MSVSAQTTYPAAARVPARRVAAEALGTATLVAAVVGSGIMAARLSQDLLLQLLVNATATVAVLAVLVAVLAPVSGAHLNPAVTSSRRRGATSGAVRRPGMSPLRSPGASSGSRWRT